MPVEDSPRVAHHHESPPRHGWLTLLCPSCGYRTHVPPQQAGITTPCPTCAKAVLVPAARPPSAGVPAAQPGTPAASPHPPVPPHGPPHLPPPTAAGPHPASGFAALGGGSPPPSETDLGDFLGTPRASPLPSETYLDSAVFAAAPGSSPGSSSSPFATAGDSSLPSRIGRYQVLSELGRGGMGVVFRGFDPALQRYVAIKMIIEQVGAGSSVMQDDVDRFAREARIAARLRHPGIVSVHEVGVFERRPFIVMDYVEGESLEAALERRPLPPRRLGAILREVALALQHAHDEGVLHRDVKPHNILINTEGKAFLSDFGLARDSASWRKLTLTGEVLGTPAYMAPEQAAGHQELQGPPTDVWALGAVLYRALCGRPPHEADAALVVIQKVISEEPVTPRRIDATIHPDLETIALRCLAKEPAHRYASAGEVAEELRRFLDGEAIHARPIGRAERALRWARRNRLAAAAIGTLWLVVLGSIVTAAIVVRTRRAQIERARGQERERLFAEAKKDAERKWAEFASAAAEGGAADLDGALARGLDALEASSRLHALDREKSEATRRLRFEVATRLGEVALAAEQWSVARSAFEKALALDIDDARVRARIVEVDRRRVAREQERERAVAAILDQARSGEIGARPGGYEDAFLELLGYRDPATVAQLAAELSAVTARLRAIARAVYGEARTPSADEARAGARPIEGLDEALDALFALAPGEPLPPAATEALDRATRRIEGREARRERSDTETTRRRSLGEIIADAQDRELDPEEALLARLCCEALGRLGLREGAVASLAAYLRAEWSPARAHHAAIALCLLGGTEADRAVMASRERFGRSTPFWTRVRRFLDRLGVDSPLAADTAEAYVARGIARVDKGDRERALADLDRAVELAPRNAAAWSARGLVLFELGRHEEAEADLSRAIELDPELADAFRYRGRARLERRLFDAAVADFARVTELRPAWALAWNDLGGARRYTGDLDGAVEACTRALEIDPGLPQAWANRGFARAAQGRHEETIADLTRSLALDARAPVALAHRAGARFALGQLAEAEEDATRAIELDPTNAPAWSVRGRARAAGGNSVSAETDFGRAIELAPNEAKHWTHRAQARHESGRAAEAFEDCEKALSLSGPTVELLELRGGIHRSLGRPAAAIADFTLAIMLDPDDAGVWNGRGRARLDTGDVQGAIADYDRAITLAPDDAMIWNNRGTARARAGDRRGAADDFGRAVALAPTLAMAWNNRARVRLLLRELDGALDDANRALELEPRNPRAWLNRALIREERREAEAALADVDRALELDPTLVEALFQRGRLRAAADRLDEAIADLERALELGPAAENRAKVEKALAELRRLRGGG